MLQVRGDAERQFRGRAEGLQDAELEIGRSPGDYKKLLRASARNLIDLLRSRI